MQHKKVYNAFQINVIVFSVFCIMLVPIMSIVSYIFDLHIVASTNLILLITGSITVVTFLVGIVYLLLTRDRYERRLKAIYQREFTILMITSGLGVLGLGILFLYLGGPALYVPHVIIPIGIAVFTGLYVLGDRYFNVSLLRRKKR
jgi:amino acid transporter